MMKKINEKDKCCNSKNDEKKMKRINVVILIMMKKINEKDKCCKTNNDEKDKWKG